MGVTGKLAFQQHQRRTRSSKLSFFVLATQQQLKLDVVDQLRHRQLCKHLPRLDATASVMPRM